MSALKSPEKRFFDQSYVSQLSSLELFIQASTTDVQFAFFDPAKKKMVGLIDHLLEENHKNWHRFTEQLDEILKGEEFKGEFKSVSFALVDKTYTLIPSSLFDDQKKESYLNLNHSAEDHENASILADEIAALNSYVVFSVPNILVKYLEGRFKKINIHHYVSSLLEAFSLSTKGDRELHLHVLRDRFDVIYYSNRKLHLLNSFPYQTVEDFIYYLLYVIEQMGIDRDKVALKIYGEIDQKSTLYDTLFQYIRHPELVSRNKAIDYSKPLDEIPAHKYYNNFNQYLCV